MWQSKTFKEDQMVVWENKTAAQQTWAELQTYFTKTWLECKQNSAMLSKQSHFQEAALLTQEIAAAEDKCKSQTKLFAMLLEQHNRQIAAMTATNKANMDAMLERMNALMAGGGGRRPIQLTRGKQGQALARLEVGPHHHLTNTRDQQCRHG
jgi:hypothetical protein